MAKIPVITVIGYSNSGKTRCMTGLISTLARRGYRVAAAKHCHDAFQLDLEGRDSWQHQQAGAAISLLSNGHQFAALVTSTQPPTLAELCERYAHEADILLAEGYSWEPFPKILVTSCDSLYDERVNPAKQVIALVGEKGFDFPLPQFTFGQLEKLAEMVEKEYLSQRTIFTKCLPNV
jgi:molybdopterin-guanine dinucleotide biosynthesis protein MobB